MRAAPNLGGDRRAELDAGDARARPDSDVGGRLLRPRPGAFRRMHDRRGRGRAAQRDAGDAGGMELACR